MQIPNDLGIEATVINDDLRETHSLDNELRGVFINKVRENSVANLGGLQAEDIVIGVEETEIRSQIAFEHALREARQNKEDFDESGCNSEDPSQTGWVLRGDHPPVQGSRQLGASTRSPGYLEPTFKKERAADWWDPGIYNVQPASVAKITVTEPGKPDIVAVRSGENYAAHFAGRLDGRY